MWIFLIILLIIVVIGVLVYFFIFKKKKNDSKTNLKGLYEIQQTVDKFISIGKGDEYSEYVSLIGKIQNKDLVTSPFTKKPLAYCEAVVSIITEKKETFKDSIGNDQTKIITKETIILNTKLGHILEFVDLSSSESAVLEINCGGCDLDIPIAINEQISPDEFESLNLDINLPEDLKEETIIGYKIKEKSIENGTDVYVVGEARASGRCIHICLPKDLKKPFIITTKLPNI